MSKDGRLPDTLRDCDMPGEDEKEHGKGCPCHEDAEPTTGYDGDGRPVLVEPECICPSDAEIAAEGAEARRDAERDR